MDPVEMFERAAGVAVARARAVSSDQLGMATPCSEWNVAALLEHMAGGPAYLLSAALKRRAEAGTEGKARRGRSAVPDRRVVFTYGWDRADVGVPPGSTVVEITLRLVAAGTELRLMHRGLEGPMVDAHAGGWGNYLGRLAARAEGRDPGVDPLAGERAPTRAQLGLPAASAPSADRSTREEP